MKPVE